MIKVEKIETFKAGEYCLEKSKLQYVLNEIKRGKEIMFESRIDFNIVDKHLNTLKIPYWVDDVNKVIWM